MGQEEPETLEPDGDDPGTIVTEGDESKASAQLPDPEPEPAEAVPEGDDPAEIETFSLEADGEERIDLSET